MRILHYSDPHIPTPHGRIPLAKWLSKRAIGGANLFMGRSRLFADAPEKIAALARFKNENKIDLVSPYNPGPVHSFESIIDVITHELVHCFVHKLALGTD